MIRKIADGSCCKQLTLFKPEKGVIITALRYWYCGYFGYCASNIRFECLPLKCSSSGQLDVWFKALSH
ncbi:hypothetical protein T07_2349 [Trichinella nelsoni]|uniref:Uncharacterized protein n=1 Tax=Trichinella nelsoni TaxID=6336 RepID=A0A0V0RCX2_9BILA|nr:hypothetical protein T07_2349 [Trichinella nelsoni]